MAHAHAHAHAAVARGGWSGTAPCPHRTRTRRRSSRSAARAAEDDDARRGPGPTPPPVVYIADYRALGRVPASLVPACLALGQYVDVYETAAGIATWERALRNGRYPKAEGGSGADSPWPREPCFSAFAGALEALDFARFARTSPALRELLLGRLLEAATEFERVRAGLEATEEETEEAAPPPSPDEAGSGGSGARGTMAEAMEAALGEEGGGEEGGEGAEETLEAVAARLAGALGAELGDLSEALEAAEEAFGGAVEVDDVVEEGGEPTGQGVDRSMGRWRASGWREVRALGRTLGRCRELREVVRRLGRRGGEAGVIRWGPREGPRAGDPEGVVRSAQAPRETRGLTRSGDVARILPGEAALLGAPPGTPLHRLFLARMADRNLASYERVGWRAEPSRVLDGVERRPMEERGPIIVCLDTSGSMFGPRETVAKALALECARSARVSGRRCFLYAFSGPGQVEELDISLGGGRGRSRPAGIAGASAASASASAGGDADRGGGIGRLIEFLGHSFHGGTDVDEPLLRSLDRLEREPGWAEADVLMVTDGEIIAPGEQVTSRLEAAKATSGLKVHGLILGGVEPGSPFFAGGSGGDDTDGDDDDTDGGVGDKWDRPEPEDVRRQRKAKLNREDGIESTMRMFCDELHHFADWSAVNEATAAAARAERDRV